MASHKPFPIHLANTTHGEIELYSVAQRLARVDMGICVGVQIVRGMFGLENITVHIFLRRWGQRSIGELCGLRRPLRPKALIATSYTVVGALEVRLNVRKQPLTRVPHSSKTVVLLKNDQPASWMDVQIELCCCNARDALSNAIRWQR